MMKKNVLIAVVGLLISTDLLACQFIIYHQLQLRKLDLQADDFEFTEA